MTPEEETVETVRENTLIALTFLAAEHNPDQEQRFALRKLILDAYPRERIDSGIFFLLNAVISIEAASLEISVPERIEQLRGNMRTSLAFPED